MLFKATNIKNKYKKIFNTYFFYFIFYFNLSTVCVMSKQVLIIDSCDIKKRERVINSVLNIFTLNNKKKTENWNKYPFEKGSFKHSKITV